MSTKTRGIDGQHDRFTFLEGGKISMIGIIARPGK